jgi:excisionase family DNA binding protein
MRRQPQSLTDKEPFDTYYVKKEAAAYLRSCIRTVDNLVAKGELPAFKVARKVLFRKRDLDALVERHRIQPLDDLVTDMLNGLS